MGGYKENHPGLSHAVNSIYYDTNLPGVMCPLVQ